jgi:hypothetical protein
VTPTEKLLSIAGPALSSAPTTAAAPADLAELLAQRNGFYAFEGALHVFSSEELAHWNEPALWRSEYGDLIAADCVFFAEDLFGNQFARVGDAVVTFDAETARCEPAGPNLSAWIADLMRDHRVMTGWPLAHEWQVANGPLPAGKRLVPKQPFVTGGEHVRTNLYLADAVAAMRFRGSLARQIADVPDGARIVFKVE